MQVLNFPGCCTAKVIVGFGQEAAASYSGHYNSDIAMATEVDRLLRGPQIGTRMGSVVVQLTSRQNRGLRVLRALGFAVTEAQSKDNHSDTSLFTLTINPRVYIEGTRDLRQLFGQPAEQKLMVRTLNYIAAKSYRRYMRMAQEAKRNSIAYPQRAEVYLTRERRFREGAKAILAIPANHV